MQGVAGSVWAVLPLSCQCQGGSVDDVVRDGDLVLLDCFSVYFLPGFCPVSWLIGVVVGGMKQDEIISTIENGFLHHTGWRRVDK